jgi:hypothetical protein
MLNAGRPAHPAAAADARTLYLPAPGRLRITSTGEALVVTREDGRVLRFPVVRLLRVVCTASSDWSGAALALCLQRGIVVSWLDGAGESAGHLWPQITRPVPMNDSLEWLAEQPGSACVYGNWLRRRRLAVLCRWAERCAATGVPVTPPEWEAAKRHYVYRGDVAQHLPSVLHGCCAAFVAARLAGEGLAPRYFAPGGQAIELAADIARLLWADMNLNSGIIAEAAHRPAEATALFERWTGANADVLHGHIADLKRFCACALAQ